MHHIHYLIIRFSQLITHYFSEFHYERRVFAKCRENVFFGDYIVLYIGESSSHQVSSILAHYAAQSEKFSFFRQSDDVIFACWAQFTRFTNAFY